MGIEAVCYSSNHDASYEDNHTEGDGAAVAGELCSPRGCSQLAFANKRDGGYHTVIVITFLCGYRLRMLWSAQDLFNRFVCHLDSLDLVGS